jgi:uncharacterized protein YndB with AHSA1/START domain
VAEEAAVTLTVRRTLRAPVERVFAAWTRAELLVRWWGPAGVRCASAEVDLRVGGRYRIGNQLPDGRLLWIEGRFEEVEPPRRLVYTWRVVADGAPPDPGNEEQVTVRFEPRGDATEVSIEHRRIPSAARRDEHEAGWRGCLDGLARLLEA